MIDKAHIETTINGRRYTAEADPRTTLADFLREELGLTGTHVGCEHGACGACTIILDGVTVRSCITYAPQANGAEITTIEGVADPHDADRMHPVQRAMRDCHGLQCGFCTPGMVLTILELLGEARAASDEEIREALSGNICRCTGYEPIVRAVRQADDDWVRTLREGPVP